MKHRHLPPLRLIVRGSFRSDPPAGIRAALPHLPDDVLRLPGETVEQMGKRALHLAQGHGVLVVDLFYADQVRH